MNNENNKVTSKESMPYNECIKVMMAYTMIMIWMVCLVVNNPYTDIVQAIWVLYIAILNFNIFVNNRKKISLALTVLLIGYFIVQFIVVV